MPTTQKYSIKISIRDRDYNEIAFMSVPHLAVWPEVHHEAAEWANKVRALLPPGKFDGCSTHIHIMPAD